MGRINLTALRVRQRALANLETRRTTIRPNWIDVVGDIPPSQVFVRSQPQKHILAKVRTKTIPPPPGASSTPESQPPRTQVVVETAIPSYRRKRKPSRLFCPLPIRYEEDSLRHTFYSDHPWELARPRVLVETTGDSHASADWSKGLVQPNMPLSGESVVQRQLHLLATEPDITVSRSYDIARKEFYVLRRQQDIQRRIAAEEAQATGASFGKNILEWSMEIENKQYDDWEGWSRQQVAEQSQKTAAFAGETMGVEDVALDEPVTERRVENGTAANGRPGPSSEIGAGLFANEAQRRSRNGRSVIA